MTVKDIGFLVAIWGGFASFFSVWQACLMQITPFFLTFSVGLYLLESDGTVRTPLLSLLYAGAGYIAGFSIVFALMGASGMGSSAYMIYNLGDFRTAASVYLAILALSMVIYNFYKSRIPHPAFRISCLPIGILLGMSFAVAYSPCIPPVMSDILNFASRPANAYKGFSLLIVYGIGVTTAFVVSGVALSVAVDYLARGKTAKKAVILLSSAILLLMAILLITGSMISYKSFLVGQFIEL